MAWTQYQTDLNSSLYPTQSQYYNCNDDSPPVYFPKEVFSSILDYCGESIENKRDRLWKKINFKKYIPMEYFEYLGFIENPVGSGSSTGPHFGPSTISMDDWDTLHDRKLQIRNWTVRWNQYRKSGFSSTPSKARSNKWPAGVGNFPCDDFTFRFNDTVLYDILDGSRDFSSDLKKKWKTLDVSTLTRSCRAVKRANRN